MAEHKNDIFAHFNKTYLDKIHTTDLGAQRIKHNLNLKIDDVIPWCVDRVTHADSITRRGKNWYVYAGDVVLTVNAHSYTIITAHKV